MLMGREINRLNKNYVQFLSLRWKLKASDVDNLSY